jgi:hypothetical protein
MQSHVDRHLAAGKTVAEIFEMHRNSPAEFYGDAKPTSERIKAALPKPPSIKP